MIPENTQEVTVTGNITGKKTGMSMDENSLVHLMGLMTNLYSDSEMAVLREYATNARDSHIEAGQTRPIEVTLPSPFAPLLSIKDYGIGMDVNDIENTYSKYGASTKRETNEQTGALGLGCKSALTYTSQFTLVGIKDGIKISVLISRDEDGAGSMTVVDEIATDEINSVEVIIPTRKHNNFESKAKHLFSFWQSDTVLLNGQEPNRVQGQWLSDDLVIVKSGNYYSTIVMGNVPYPATIDHGLNHGYQVVAFVGMGDVHFPPARESLNYSAKTKATITGIEGKISSLINNAVQRSIDKAKTPREAVREILAWYDIIPDKRRAGDYTYRGEPLPYKLDVPNGTFTTAHASTVLSRTERITSVGCTRWPEAVWVEGYEGAGFTATKKKKLKKYAEDNGIENVSEYILIPAQYTTTERETKVDKDGNEVSKNKTTFHKVEPMDRKWLNDVRFVSWEDVKAVKLPQTRIYGKGPSRLSGSYDLIEDDQRLFEVPADVLVQSKVPLFWGYSKGSTSHVISHFHNRYVMVLLPQNRIAKFKRDFPHAKNAQVEGKRLTDKWVKSISNRKREALFIQSQSFSYQLKNLNPIKIDDPKLRRVIRLADADLNSLSRTAKMLGVTIPPPKDWVNPLTNYALFNEISGHYYLMKNKRIWSEMYLYINACYQARGSN